MRGRGKHRRRVTRSPTGEPTDAREALERKWFRRIVRSPELRPLVTGEQLAAEPFHRWLPYRQAFAPELVRRYLQEAAPSGSRSDFPVLDPFAGSGTLTIECARRGHPVEAIEALDSLVFVAQARGARELPDPPTIADCEHWRSAADRLTEPLHRAALLCAVARRHTAEGRENRGAPPLPVVFAEVLDLIREDLRSPLPQVPRIERGDARVLERFADESVGGILTSPPYLSRHDYTRTTEPLETVYRHWYGGRELSERREIQVRAHPRAYAQVRSQQAYKAVTESCEALRCVEQPKLAGVVRSYFEDMHNALAEACRVLASGAIFWMVVGGARLKGVYVPSDTILADAAEDLGLAVEAIREARQLTPSGRRLGGLERVAPRESVLLMRKPG